MAGADEARAQSAAQPKVTVMAIEIKLPELGENIDEGDVVEVRVAAGAEVRAGQTLLEVEAEKSTVEVPSPGAGRIARVLVKKGDKVKPGQTLFEMDEAATGGGQPPPPRVETKPAAQSKPPTGETPPWPPPVESRPPVGNKAPTAAPPAQSAPGAVPAPRTDVVVPAGPATRRLARELGIDLALVHGTASSGRVTQEDVKAFVKALAAGQAGLPPGAAALPLGVPPLPDFGKWGNVERQPIDAVGRKMAEQMALAWRVIPHVTHNDLADITELEGFRKREDGRGPKLTVTAFALKAVAIALKQFPRFNSTLDLANNQLILKHYYHLGLAVDTERGLLVPVLHDVDKKSVQELAREMADLADRARQKKISADDLRGGTFTISNLGGIGGTSFTPIVNYPEVAILGLSRGRLQPVCRADGQITPRLLLPLSLSYDHRVIDGAAAARFVRCIVEMLENPLVMLLHA
jgi:pyruvate dehydrogenase E2 component (dihydrolipoamide acetyltransferase)